MSQGLGFAFASLGPLGAGFLHEWSGGWDASFLGLGGGSGAAGAWPVSSRCTGRGVRGCGELERPGEPPPSSAKLTNHAREKWQVPPTRDLPLLLWVRHGSSCSCSATTLPRWITVRSVPRSMTAEATVSPSSSRSSAGSPTSTPGRCAVPFSRVADGSRTLAPPTVAIARQCSISSSLRKPWVKASCQVRSSMSVLP